MSGPEDLLMLGGGNPGRIPELDRYFRASMQRLLNDGDRFERMLGVYDHPRGNRVFLTALAEMLRSECGWPIDESNLALTNGSQSSFFQLFNLLGGVDRKGRLRRILLPLIPEYIGYGDTGLEPGLFEALRPRVHIEADGFFKYHLDFEGLHARLERSTTVGGDIAALCISRPANPTGNVLGDQDLVRLADCAREHGIPLIVDCAYGWPFPGIVFTESSPIWNDQMIVTLSLSKFGLPGVRTGIVVARPDVIRALGRMNAVMNLTGGSVGPALALDMVRSREILRLSREVIGPHYRRKSTEAVALLRELSGDLTNCRVHRNEGAFFLWLWFAGLPVPAAGLYERLKQRGVLVVPGHYYFPGLVAGPEADWPHRHECIRVSIAQPDEIVHEGLRRIIAEVRAIWQDAG